MFENCKWIWIHNEEKKDEYADFLVDFELEDTHGVNLDISFDGNFEAYLNGKLCAFGSCADYPFYKLYDSFSLDNFAKCGKNQLKITVWHIGMECFVYAKSNAGLIFKVSQNGNDIAVSDDSILSRQNLYYSNGRGKLITSQLGPSYRYDNTVENNLPYTKSVIVEKTMEISKRPIENLVLLPRMSTGVNDDGKRLVIDLDQEVAGYLDLEFESDGEQELVVVFGEHFDDSGRVPRFIGSRDFSIDFVARDGKNEFLGMMRRIAGRYIEIEHEKPLKINYIGIRPVEYPVTVKERRFESELHQRIYDVCINTLRCCMHEHYEDCAWREQALYSLDSRNQMLCGYIAFEEYRYARFNIVLLAKSLRNGLIRITSPTDRDLPIPFFSLTFVQQVADYVEFSGDRSIIDEVKLAIDTVMKTFADLIDDCGLISAPKAPAWNFYEWTDGNDGSVGFPESGKRYDLCLNAMYLYMLPKYRSLGGVIDVDEKKMAESIKNTFYCKERGLFRNMDIDNRISVIGNSLALLAGVGDAAVAERLVNERDSLTDVSLSMNSYFYDALLSFGDKYKAYMLSDIEEKYGYMLDCGATTFWETIEGWHAFFDAGSLCHGWSALPVYCFDVLNI